LFESLRGILRLKVVVRQLLQLLRQVVRQHVEPQPPVGRCLAGHGGPSFIARVGGLSFGLVDGQSLLVDDVVKLSGNVIELATEVAALLDLLATFTQSPQNVAQPFDVLTVAIAQPLLHDSP